MARMMPAYCPQSAPPGERAVFAALAAAEATDDWFVLHSLGIANHVRQVEGEADFVVIAPEIGLIVIEVKSHQTIERLADGRWRLGTQQPTSRGPFQQAAEAMHSVRNYLDKKRPGQLRDVPVLSAVWFTGVRARSMLPANPEWHTWQVLDSEDLKNNPAAVIRRVAHAGTEHLRSKLGHFGESGIGPDAETAARIAGMLRPRFEAAVVPADVRSQRQAKLVELLDEQYQALDAMADHRAVLFTGPAGSGKTLLAMESARREAEQGRQGRLLCYNRLLGQNLSAHAHAIPNLRAGTLHQELLRISGLQPPEWRSHDFWQRELPERAAEVLLGGDRPPDEFLILDEVQDLAKQPYLDVLDLMVEGGLKSARIQLFGDFERQALFGAPDSRETITNAIPGLVSHRLTMNCRNLPRIGYVVNTFSRLEPGYKRFRRQDDGADPTFHTYVRGEDQSPLLVAAVRQLREEGFDLTEIAVLSPLAEASTAEATQDAWLRGLLRALNHSQPTAGQLRYTTVHAFKGMEAPAVIVTDLDQADQPNFDAIVYVALTRATDRLIAIMESTTLRSALGGTA